MTGMDQDRFVVSDAVWAKIASLLPGKATDPGATGKDNRLFLEAVLWRVRTGSPWRDLPSGFGNWNSVFQRFRRWVRARIFERLFEQESDEPDFEYALIDGTIVSAHQKASGAKGGLEIRPSAADRGHRLRRSARRQSLRRRLAQGRPRRPWRRCGDPAKDHPQGRHRLRP